MKVAILGARGIPACYSGYDTLTEELSTRLVESSPIEVLVYCRSSYYTEQPPMFRGVKLIYLPAPRGLKGWESISHSFLSSLHVLGQGVDVIYFLDPANAPFCLLLRCLGKKVVIHTDGLGWKRRKWGPIARRYYKAVERLCALAANALVTDNPAMQSYYRNQYKVETLLIAYGATNRHGFDPTVYGDLKLEPKKYCLVVARLEPENNVDLVIRQYVKSDVSMPLVVVGDAPYGPEYMKKLRRLANHGVLFSGRISDQAKLNALYRGAYLYIHGHEVGGTNPSLLRAMDAGVAPIVVNVPFNASVIGEEGLLFEKWNDSLSELLRRLMADQNEVMRLSEGAKARANVEFCWASVASRHHDLFAKLAATDSREAVVTRVRDSSESVHP